MNMFSDHGFQEFRKIRRENFRFNKLFALTLTALIGQSNIAAAQTGPVLDIVIAARDSCLTFKLRVIAEGGGNTTREFVNKDGTRVMTITAGKGYSLTLINTTSNATLRIRPSGSVQKSIVNQDGSTTFTNTGHNVLIQFASDIPGPSAIQYIGRLIYTVDPSTGIFTIDGTSGRQVDICAALSG